MLPDLAVSPAICRRVLACWLCALALVFAFEAKTAWYGPDCGPGSAVRAAKALPADLPQVVSHGVPTPDPVRPAIPFLIFGIFALPGLSGLKFDMMRSPHRRARMIAPLSNFSPPQFFRPPPIY